MKLEILEGILSQQRSVKKDGGAFVVGADLPLTLFVAIGHELLQIARVVRVELRKDVLVVENNRHETYFLAYESIEGAKVEAAADPAKGAGFR